MAKFNEKGYIVELEKNEIICVGTNLEGNHIGGAAKQAYEQFGAIWGIGVGMAGQTYAIPTMPPLTLSEIEVYIKQFIDWASLTPEYTYYVTPIGCGIAGYSKEEMGEVWSRYSLPKNIILL